MADGSRVTILIDATETSGTFDLVDVHTPPGTGSCPDRHAFAEWFHVVAGSLQFLGMPGGRLKPTATVEAGGTYVVPPWAPHAIRNNTEKPARFIVAGQPGVMSSYYAQAGLRVPDTQTRVPVAAAPDPSALAELAARHKIQHLPK